MIELILVVLSILAIIGLSVYFFIDVKKHKESNATDFSAVNTGLKTEKDDRLANLKFIVDQVNKTHKDMDADYNKKITENTTGIKDVNDRYTAFETGFGSIIKTVDAAGTEIPVRNLSTLPLSDIQMIKHVSAIGGLTVKELEGNKDKPELRLKACGKGKNAKCIELPNETGDTYITNIVDGKSIVLDGPVIAKGLSKFHGGLNIGNLGDMNANVLSFSSTDRNTARVDAEEITFRLSSLPTEAVNLSKDGTVIKNGLVISNEAGTAQATLKVTPDNSLEITGLPVKISGNVTVNGVPVTGASTSGQTSQTVPTASPLTQTTSQVSSLLPLAPSSTTSSPQTAGFCSLTDNKNYMCVDNNYPTLTDKQFKIESGARREYTGDAFTRTNQTLDVNNILYNCSPLNSCPVGTVIA